MSDSAELRASFDDADAAALGERLRSLVDIRDRRYGFPPRTYVNCFLGSNAVQALIDESAAVDAADAVRLGNMLLDAGVFHHVLKEHPFKDDALFYRFAADEDHGVVATKLDGSAVSWADFLAPVTGDDSDTRPASLQPAIPERDAQLGEFAQDDLETAGVSPLDAHNTALLDCVHPKKWVNPSPKAAYNLVVIGAGAGGLVTSAAAAGIGARVASPRRSQPAWLLPPCAWPDERLARKPPLAGVPGTDRGYRRAGGSRDPRLRDGQRYDTARAYSALDFDRALSTASTNSSGTVSGTVASSSSNAKRPSFTVSS
jgi:hypothetical protein